MQRIANSARHDDLPDYLSRTLCVRCLAGTAALASA
jgi:hypothetical protein